MATKKESKQDGTFDLQWIEVSKLRPAKYNPRKDLKPGDPEYESLKKSINEFGLVDPIIVNKDMTVIGGHQRLKIIMEAGFDKVPCSVVDLDKQHEKLLNIALNKISGDWDLPILRDLIISLDDGSLDMSITGFNSHELELMMTAIHPDDPADAEPQIDKAAELNKVWKVATGDLWQIGSHRLLCGDSTKAGDVARVMGGEKAVLMNTDPPYGINVDHTWRDKAEANRLAPGRTGKVENDDRASWMDAFALSGAQVVYVWHSALHADVVFNDLIAAGYDIRQQIIWVKDIHALSRSAYHWKHEPCWYAVQKGKDARWKAGRDQFTVWNAPSPIMAFGGGKDDCRTPHPTQKPLAITIIPIQNHTDEGEFIYDPFLGSGTTMVACQNLNRKCGGIEISPDYCAVILQRMQDAFPSIDIRRIDQ